MTHRRQRGLLWAVLLLLVVIIVVFGGKNWLRSPDDADLPFLSDMPDFKLTDQNGRTLTNKSFLGRTWIADFFFTRCLGPCPVLSSTMSDLQDEIPSDVAFVSFSMDPGYDTPEVLMEYAKRHEADLDRWTFLTGDSETIYNIPRALGLAAEEGAGDEGTIIHSSRYLLIDPDGKVRGWYTVVNADFETDEAELERMKKDLGVLLRSVEKG